MKNSNSLMEKTKKIMKVITNVSPPAIDYPREGEQILQGSYTIRISAQPEQDVQVSINGGEWNPCRWAVGHYWSDWEPSEPGPTKMACRSRAGKGRWKTSETRTVEVV